MTSVFDSVTWILLRSNRLAHPEEPADCRQRLLRYGVEYADTVDLSVARRHRGQGLFLAEREGHPPPRIVETPAGMLNAIGLQGIGVHRFIDEKLPELRARRATVSSTSAARPSTNMSSSPASCRTPKASPRSS